MQKIVFLVFILGLALAQPFSAGFPQLKYNYSGCSANQYGLYGLYTDLQTECNAHFNYKPDPNVAINQAQITQFVLDYISYGTYKKFVYNKNIVIQKDSISYSPLGQSIFFSFPIKITNFGLQKHEKYVRLRAKLIVEYSNGIKQPFEVTIPIDY